MSKYIEVKQVGSPIGRHKSQKATLKGLGLDKMNRTKVLEDTPSVRGMVNKVKHLVEVTENVSKPAAKKTTKAAPKKKVSEKKES